MITAGEDVFVKGASLGEEARKLLGLM